MSLRGPPINNKHDEGAAVTVQKRTACSNSISWAKALSTAETHKFTTKCSQYNNMVTSALIYRRIKVGAANFLGHQWIEQQPNSFFATGIEKLVLHWNKCVTVLGGYVEKLKLLFNPGFTYCSI